MKITAEIIADSKNLWGDRITTFKLVFPRYILAEINTHRAFSKNSASSRAIPFKKMVKMVEENPFIPMAWQKDHKGMQGTEYFTNKKDIFSCEMSWERAKDKAVASAKDLHGNGVTKQLANRLLEPYMWHTVLLTTTGEGLENFFDLRCPQYEYHGVTSDKKRHYKSKTKWKEDYSWNHVDDPHSGMYPKTIIDWLQLNRGQADIHMMALAEQMYDVYNESKPKELREGEFHIPMGETFDDRELDKLLPKFRPASVGWYIGAIEDLKVKIATARCARVSYYTLGDEPKIDYEADLKLYQTLLDSRHFSPMEHVAQCQSESKYYANFKGWKQHRHLI